MIAADGGGSNGARVRLRKWELEWLADETGLTITACHLPPGIGKWNTIEHRPSPSSPGTIAATAGQPRGDPQPDRRHDHGRWPYDQEGLGYLTLPGGAEGL